MPAIAELERLFNRWKARVKPGASQQRWLNAGIALDRMRKAPEHAYACGARALHILRRNQGISDAAHDRRIVETKAGAEGMSLEQLEGLARSAGMAYRKSRRSASSPIPDASILHWKGGHFATVVKRFANGDYLVEDPADELRRRVSGEVMDEETSGYFLVPNATPRTDFPVVAREEADKIKGKSYYWTLSLLDDPCPNECPTSSKGIAGYALDMFKAGYVIKDTPIWIETPYGFDIDLTVTWSRNAQQRPNWTEATHLEDPNWAVSGVSLVYEIGQNDVEIFLPDGRKETHFYNGSGYDQNYMSGAQLTKYSSSHYERVGSDGSKLVYKQLVTGSNNRIYLTEMVDPDGNKLTISYYSAGKIYSVSDDLGNGLYYAYSGSSTRLTSVYDSRNSSRSATFAYSGSDLDYITDPEGIKSDFTYSGGNITALGTPYGWTSFSFVQNTSDQKTEITDPESHVEKVHYNDDWGGYLLAGIDGSGNADSPERPSGSYWAITDINEGVTLYWDKKAMNDYPFGNSYHHHAASQYVWAKKDYGSTTLIGVPSCTRSPADTAYRTYYQYEGTPPYDRVAGDSSRPAKVASVVRNENNSLVTRETAYTYNTQGNLTQVTDPVGRKTKLTYHGNGIDVKQIDQYDTAASGNWQKLAYFSYYSGTHRVYEHQGPDGQWRTFTYNSKGQVATVADPTGTTRFLYDSSPQNGGTNGHGYLMKIQRKSTGSYKTVMENTAFDIYNRPTSTNDADGYTIQREYDMLDRTTKIIHPGPGASGTNYEEFKYQSGATMYADLRAYRDREGKWTYYTYTGNRQLKTVDDPENSAHTVYEWCRCGDLESITDPSSPGQKTTWHRDLLGRVTQKDEPGGLKYKYTYFVESGLPKAVHYPADFSGSATATYRYFKDGNLQKIDHISSNTPDVEFAYDSFYNRRTWHKDGASAAVSSSAKWNSYYRAFQTLGGGQLDLLDGPFSFDGLKFTYDNMGRVDTRLFGYNGYAFPNTYDTAYDYLGRLTTLSTGQGTFGFEYEGGTSGTSPLVNHISYPNGQHTYFDYLSESSGRFLNKIRNQKFTSGTKISEHTYAGHTNSGQIGTWKRDAALPQNSYNLTFSMAASGSYDNLYRLKSATQTGGTDFGFAYDPAGNRTQKTLNTSTTTYTYTANRVQSATGGWTFTYNGNGCLTHKKLNGVTKAKFEWDSINRLLAIEIPGVSRSEFSYDAFDRRYKMIEKTWTGSGWSSGTTSYLFWDGTELVQKRVGSSSASANAVNYYAGQGETRRSGFTNTHYFYTTDHLGSVREVTNWSKTVVAAYDYSPYGVRDEVYSSGGFTVEPGYTGHFFTRTQDCISRSTGRTTLTWGGG